MESFQKQGKLPADNVKAKGIIKKLFNFIVLNDRPLSQPDWTLRATVYFTIQEILIRDCATWIYNQVSTKLAEKLKGVRALSFTADTWTSDVCPMSDFPVERSLFQPHIQSIMITIIILKQTELWYRNSIGIGRYQDQTGSEKMWIGASLIYSLTEYFTVSTNDCRWLQSDLQQWEG